LIGIKSSHDGTWTATTTTESTACATTTASAAGLSTYQFSNKG
jgi:hypothetical protein